MIKILEESKNNLLAVRVRGDIESRDFDILNPILEKTIEEHDHPLAYIELLDLESFTPKAVMEDLKNVPKYNQFEKVAMVGDAKWKEIIIKAAGTLMKSEVKYFNYDQKTEAMAWLKN